MSVSPLPDVTLLDDSDLRAVIVRAKAESTAAANAVPPPPARSTTLPWAPCAASPSLARVASVGVPRLASDRARIETNMDQEGHLLSVA